MRRLVDELAFIGSPYSDDDLIIAILNGLGPKYDSFVIFVTTAAHQTPFTFADLYGHLLSHESQLQGQVFSSPGTLPSPHNPSAFAVRYKSGYPNRP
jgi:gag-polypeptide of LTR copia-type